MRLAGFWSSRYRRPRLQWSTPPADTQELAMEMLDPGAPGGTVTHRLVYGMPPGISGLAAVPAGAAEGVNDCGRRGYGGRARRGARRITTTWWSWRWTPGSAWQPERPGPPWHHASAVTCWPGANRSRPTTARDGIPARTGEPDRRLSGAPHDKVTAVDGPGAANARRLGFQATRQRLSRTGRSALLRRRSSLSVRGR